MHRLSRLSLFVFLAANALAKPHIETRDPGCTTFMLAVNPTNGTIENNVPKGSSIENIGGPLGFGSPGNTLFWVEPDTGYLKSGSNNACLQTGKTNLPAGTVVMTTAAGCGSEGAPLLKCDTSEQFMSCSTVEDSQDLTMQQCGEFLNLAAEKQTRDGCGDLIALSYTCYQK